VNKPTFNQIAALALSGLCLILLALICFFHSHGTQQIIIVGAICSTLSACVVFLVGESKNAQHAEQTKQMIDALANSQPAVKN
jgi:hypothetical protein